MAGNSSYYTYKKYVTYHQQDPLPYLPITYSVDGEGTMPLMLKNACDEECGCVTHKFKLDEYVINCNGNPTLTTDEFGYVLENYHTGHYPYNPVTMEIGDCVEIIESLGDHTYYTHNGSVIIARVAMEYLSGLTLSDSVKKMESGAYYFSALRGLELNDGLEYVGYNAFGTSLISHLVYPDTIDYVGMNVLSGAPVQYVEFLSDTPPTTMYRPQENIDVIPIYVPSGSVSTYRQAFPDLADEIMPTNQRIKLANIDMPCQWRITSRLGDTSLSGYPWYATANNQQVITDADVAKITRLGGNSGKDSIDGCVNIGSNVVNIGFKAFSTGNDTLNYYPPTSTPTINNITFDSGSSLQVIEAGAFYGAQMTIYELHLPDSLETIGYRAFCTADGGISKVFIPSGVTIIDSDAFAYSRNGKEFYFASPTPYSGMSTHMFGREEDTIYMTIYVPSSGVEAYREHFSDIPTKVHAWDKAVLTYIDDTTYTISGNGLDNIVDSEVVDYYNIKSAVINNSITSITDGAFALSKNLSAVTLPDTLKVIGFGAFDGCSSLTNITIPNSVETIGRTGFYGCTSLESINIPSGVTNIGFGAFDGCSGLTGITVNATTPPTISNNSFDNTNNCPIYVPAVSICDYKETTNWEAYGDRLQTIGGEPYSGC